MSELEQLHNKLEKIAKSYVQKSIDGRPLSAKVAHAIAITKATTQDPDGRRIARRILELEQQQEAGLSYGIPVTKGFTAKNGPLEMQTDDELLASLKEVTRELKRRGYVEEEEDDWSSAFEEA
ncbi:MAG: hypothetical protein A4E49_00160 [Methanosaeta sp. PtaU1.Bin112]|nr:MAG: hypothetical protein A4E49_00160 [Methanosaeta sp. PtaU1.Bin112]